MADTSCILVCNRTRFLTGWLNRLDTFLDYSAQHDPEVGDGIKLLARMGFPSPLHNSCFDHHRLA